MGSAESIFLFCLGPFACQYSSLVLLAFGLMKVIIQKIYTFIVNIANRGTDLFHE